MHVAADSPQAEEEMKEAFRAMYESYARWGQPGERYDLEFDQLKEERILVGSPREVAERVAVGRHAASKLRCLATNRFESEAPHDDR